MNLEEKTIVILAGEALCDCGGNNYSPLISVSTGE